MLALLLDARWPLRPCGGAKKQAPPVKTFPPAKPHAHQHTDRSLELAISAGWKRGKIKRAERPALSLFPGPLVLILHKPYYKFRNNWLLARFSEV